MAMVKECINRIFCLLLIVLFLGACASAPAVEKTKVIDEGITALIAKYTNIINEQNLQVLSEIYAPDAGYYIDYLMGVQDIPAREGSRLQIGAWWGQVVSAVSEYQVLSRDIQAEGDSAVAKLTATVYADTLGMNLKQNITLKLAKKDGAWMIQDENVICEEITG